MMNLPCDCCQGVHVATPATVFNRPGLGSLNYRAGTYGTFFESMQSRLSSPDFPALTDLKTRELSDASMALIDAWAVVGDVLTFYQERIANEGYLRTATEFRSVIELARLVGYTPRPGVAAGVYLAYLLEDGAAPVEIPKGARSNSIPGPGEQMQAFETSEPLLARREWNDIKPRRTSPLRTLPDLEEEVPNPEKRGDFYLKGIVTGLTPDDPLVIGYADDDTSWGLFFVAVAEPDSMHDRTRVVLRRPPDKEEKLRKVRSAREKTPTPQVDLLTGMVKALDAEPSIQLANAQHLRRDANESLASGADTVTQLLAASRPALSDTLAQAWRKLPPASLPQVEVYALRITAAPFGHNAPLKQVLKGDTILVTEWDIKKPVIGDTQPTPPPPQYHEPNTLFLDNDYDLAPDGFVVVQEWDRDPKLIPPVIVARAPGLNHRSLNAYGLSGKTIEVTLEKGKEWLNFSDGSQRRIDTFQTVRTTRVYTGSEKLELAEMPIENPVCKKEIELDGLYAGLEAGRWLIVSGERSGPGVPAAEVAMIASVRHDLPVVDGAPVPGEVTHTFLTLVTDLASCYARETVAIYGNVVKATHGETRHETLGSGEATKAFQTFELKQPPLTFVSASTTSGLDSTLQVLVDDISWRETETLAALTPTDRKFVTRADDAGKTRVIFGDGKHGERPHTGLGNIKAVYRNGIGRGGNVKAGQIALLNTRPLGAKDVTNPVPASGGAERETLSQVRGNAPLALLALDRLVSTKDYADFTRTFAGVGKAAAKRASKAHGVQVTIAGVDDIPIDLRSDLYRNLKDALRRFGDPQVPIALAVRRRAALVISARVRIDADRQWETVEPRIRAALLERFGFERTELGQVPLLSDAFAAIQGVDGVVYSDVDVFDAISDDELLRRFTGAASSDPAKDNLHRRDAIPVDSDSIAYLTPDVPDTLILQEAKL